MYFFLSLSPSTLSWKTQILLSLQVTDLIISTSELETALNNSADPNSFDPTVLQLCHHEPGALGDGEVRPFPCAEGLYGRYVSVDLPSTTQYLHFCEVEVFGSGEFFLFLSYSLR